MNATVPDAALIGIALMVAETNMDRLRLRSIPPHKFLMHWAEFSLLHRQMLLDRCQSDAQRVKVLKRLEEYQAIVVASKLVGDEE